MSAHAISNPTLAGIEKRWEGMPPQEQADLWMALRDRMKVDWHQMTMQEKKAGMICGVLSWCGKGGGGGGGGGGKGKVELGRLGWRLSIGVETVG